METCRCKVPEPKRHADKPNGDVFCARCGLWVIVGRGAVIHFTPSPSEPRLARKVLAAMNNLKGSAR